jgi:hypothetical protein
MKTLIPITNKKLTELQSHNFFIWSNQCDDPFEDKFSFVPAMSFFILGLRDIYSEFADMITDIPKEQTLINYCDLNMQCADVFLEDLERLGFTSSSWGGPLRNIFSKTWSAENSFSRKYIYKLHHLIQNNTIEENIFTFGLVHDQLYLLMNAMANVETGQPVSSNLNFFHFKEEAIWPKGHLDVAKLVDQDLPGQSYYRCYDILITLDKYFHNLLDQWLILKNEFKRNILLGECQFMSDKNDIRGILH